MGKSKSAPAPLPPDPMAEARARDWEAQQAETRAEAARQRQKLEDEQKLAEKTQKWNGARNNYMQSTQDYGREKLSQYGLGPQNDPYGIWSSFNSTLSRNNANLQDNDEYGNLLGTNVFDNALADTRTATRNKYARDFNNQLGNDYYDQTFASTIDDNILDSILNTQYNDASNSIKNAFDRGQMNSSAFDRAMESLGKAKTGARGELETIGQGVINSAKQATQKAGDSAISRANNFDFNDIFDVGSEVGKVRDAGTKNLSTLETDINRALGDRTFFDPNSYIAKSVAAGGASGYNAPQTGVGGGSGGSNSSLYSVFDDQARKKATEGVF